MPFKKLIFKQKGELKNKTISENIDPFLRAATQHLHNLLSKFTGYEILMRPVVFKYKTEIMLLILQVLLCRSPVSRFVDLSFYKIRMSCL